MCLAVPMKIVEIRADGKGVADLDGIRHVVDLSLVTVRLGVYVIVHAGFAIETLDQEEADATLALFAEIARDADGRASSRLQPTA
ncbi:MAG: HypC/HybG/HupF family hydrogenase formation chaperone [bacterium]